MLIALVVVFLAVFSIQMGWFSGAKKPASEAPVPSGSPGAVAVSQEPGKANVEEVWQQLRAAQTKVTTLSLEAEGLRLQRTEAIKEASRLSNVLAAVTRESETLRNQASAALEEAKAEILARSRRIEVLEGEIGALTQQLRDLAERLGRQDARIAEAERKGATSDSERAALKATLAALQAERRVLEERFQAKESLLAGVRRQRDSEVAARDSLFRRNWLAKSKAAEASKSTQSPAGKATASKPGAVKVRVDVSEVTSPRAKGPWRPSRTNSPSSSVTSGRAR